MAEEYFGREAAVSVRVYVFCEGQTEEQFVARILRPAFQARGIELTPIIFRTSRSARGGVTSYGKVKWQIETKCKEDRGAWVTTMIDYYGLPTDFPEAKISVAPQIRAQKLRDAFQNDIGEKNFIANLLVHEYEALLFSAPSAFANSFGTRAADELIKIRADVSSPEDINDRVETAPSKRIQRICGGYQKPLHGILIAEDIGLEAIRRECAMFNTWLQRLESLSSSSDG